MVDFNKLLTPEYQEEYKRRREEENRQQELEQELRNKTCAFTGHRPNKLGGYDWHSEKNLAIGRKLREQIIWLIENENVTRFICGGALGIDQMAFSICQKLKETKYPDLYLILAMPFEKQDNNWFNQVDKDRLAKQRKQANEVVLVDELNNFRYNVEKITLKEYHPAKMSKRNEWMVDHSKYLIAVWDGTKGGTGNCVRYFRKQVGADKMLLHINPKDLSVEIS